MKKRALALLGIISLSLLIVNPLTAYAESYQKIYVDDYDETKTEFDKSEWIRDELFVSEEEMSTLTPENYIDHIEVSRSKIKVNLDLDGGTLDKSVDIHLTHERCYNRWINSGASVTDTDLFSVGDVKEIGEPEKEGYTFIGWHGSSEIYTNTEPVDYTPIEIRYIDYYAGWSDEELTYSPRLVDENNNKIDEITLTAVYVPNLVINAGDGAFADGSKTIEIKADQEQSDTSRYVYLIPEESSPVYNDMIGVLELESDNTERDGYQVLPGEFIDVIPGETVEVVYEQRAVEETSTLVVQEPDIEFADIDEDEEIEATAFGKFLEAIKKAVVKIISIIAILAALAILLGFILRKLRVEVQNNKKTDEYSDDNFVTVQKDRLKVEGNILVLLGKFIDKNNKEDWQLVIKDETLNNRESNDFKIMLNESFVKKFNGNKIVVKIGEDIDAKTEAFIIDEQEKEIKFTVDLNE